MHCGCRATQQAAPAKTYMQNKADTMTTKPNEFPRQECGFSVTLEPLMGSVSFLVSDQLKDFIETSKERKESAFDRINALERSIKVSSPGC